MEARAPSRPRFWINLQPSIVRLYKVAGLIALTAILVGLIGFLVVNVFYFFDHTWVRPITLSPTHQKVVEASRLLADGKTRLSQLGADKIATEEEQRVVDRTITADEKFIEEMGTSLDAPKTPEQWLLREKLDEKKLERENQLGKRAPLAQRLESLKLRIKDEDALVNRLSQSPYLKAMEQQVVLAFVPYQNTSNAKPGASLYGCRGGLVACHKVGKVTVVLEGEVQETHPHDESVQRGVMVEIEVSKDGANESVLFAGSKPLGPFSF
jgi:hypothetical protein